MAFIRSKKIKGISYYYLVESKRINGKVRQKVLKYIGNSERLAKMVENER